MFDYCIDWGLYGPLLGASVFVCALLGFIVYATTESPSDRAAIYHAWLRANPTQNLSQEDFELLRRNELLPGQVPNHADEDMAAEIAVGSSTNGAAR